MISVKKIKYAQFIVWTVILMGAPWFLNGCVAALPVVAMAGGAAAGAGAVSASKTANVNQPRDQYPNIDFAKPAPVGTVYGNNFNEVWEATINTLNETKELMSLADKNSGLIRTSKRNFNDISLKGKGSENSTFMYETIISVRAKVKGVSVETLVPFWEEKFLGTSKEINIPEGSSVIRHIFYFNLNKKLNPVAFRFPDDQVQDLRTSSQKNEGRSQEQGPEGKAAEPTPIRELEKTEEQPPKIIVLEKVKIKRSPVKLLDLPLREGKVLAILKAGDEPEKLDEKGDWLKVRCTTKNTTVDGWIIKYDCEGYTRIQKRKTSTPGIVPFPSK
jgi:hypothetical protein